MYLCAAKVKANKFTHKYEKKHLRLSFTSGGAKTITHTVKTPNGGTLTASATIHVLPAGVGEPLGLTETQNYILYNALADYNYDGRMDGFNSHMKTVQVGTNTDELFAPSEGLWNTNIDASSTPRWFDRNMDGHTDLVFYDAYLPHESNGTSLTPLVYDDALKEIYPQDNTGIYTDRDTYYVLSDLDNNG